MTNRDAYVRIKKDDLKALNEEVGKLDKRSAGELEKLRIAIQSADSMLDRVVNSHDDDWRVLQAAVDGAFRHAFDCLHRIEAR